jgi:hypothetical protein
MSEDGVEGLPAAWAPSHARGSQGGNSNARRGKDHHDDGGYEAQVHYPRLHHLRPAGLPWCINAVVTYGTRATSAYQQFRQQM